MSLADDLTRAMQGIFENAVPAERPDFSEAFIASLSPRIPAEAMAAPDEPVAGPEAIGCPEALHASPEERIAPAVAPSDPAPRSAFRPDRGFRRRSGRRSFGGYNPNWRKVEAITVEINPRTGNIEIRFPGKPVAAVRDQLKTKGWRWSGTDGCWYHSNTAQSMQFANTLAG